MEDATKQLADKIQAANNILVTVSRDPSVDQLAGCLGLTLLLDKMGKHAVAVFSGAIPSTLEFLEPDKTLEKNTDSLRDFIIALDKNKADKLRYKVEDNVVRIFITPYKTSISEADFEFSQGDFNVDVIVALGVHEQEDLDQAITAHGRILHDATIISINTLNEGTLGVLNWFNPQASSLSEMVTELAETLGAEMLDTQIATALLTGIVAETDRFSNDKTSSQTMNVSAALMAAGANQQLVASKLREPAQPRPNPAVQDQAEAVPADNPDGLIAIDHNGQLTTADQAEPPPADKPAVVFEVPPPDFGRLTAPPAQPPSAINAVAPGSNLSPGARMITEPPTLGAQLTANTVQEGLDPVTDPLSLPSAEPPHLMARKPRALDRLTVPAPTARPSVMAAPPPIPTPANPAPLAPPPGLTPAPPAWLPPPVGTSFSPTTSPPPLASPAPPPPPPTPPPGTSTEDDHTLAELETAVHSSHAAPPNLDAARDEVSRALSNSAATAAAAPEPVQALGAQPLGEALHPVADNVAPIAAAPADDGTDPNLEEILSHTEADAPTNDTPEPDTDADPDPGAPPPVPPPIPFQFGNPPAAQ